MFNKVIEGVIRMKKLNTQTFIERANIVHTNKYSYNETAYVNARTKVKVFCPEHGSFKQTAATHLSGSGCPTCAKNKRPKSNVERSSNKFIEKARVIHKDKYGYNKISYAHSKTKVTVTCPEHGDFEQTPNSHLNGYGCAKCGSKSAGEFFAKDVNEFIAESDKVHNSKYDYSNVIYTNSKTKVIINCPIHGDFEQTPNNHLTGYGCQDCAITGFDNTKRAVLYYLKITTNTNQTLYKIGITNRTVNERFNLIDLSKIEVIKQKECAKGLDAYKYEQEILKKYSEYKYVGPKILKSGNTELFRVDILEFENCEMFDV